jgi:hypothetical protein
LAELITIEVVEGWAEGVYRSGENDAVWSAHVKTEGRVGASRVIVVSKGTGSVLFDGTVGE